MFSVRIVTTSHYQAQPIRDLDVTYSDFRGSEVKQVPVLRIFGATPVGQKTCLHIHGVFPYIYVRCGAQEFNEAKDLRQFATSLDLALQVAMGKASGTTHHVFKVVNVQAVPMYGYHSRSHSFLKVYFYNPLMVKRAVELLQSGAVMNKVFQPHEAHIPFILQFFIDYNLYGMNLIHLAAVKFRRQKPENDAESESSSPHTPPVNLSSMLTGSDISSHRWSNDNIPSGLLLDVDVKKQSVCELEVDAVAIDILNRHELQGNTEMNPGLLAIYNEERERREVRDHLDDLHPPASPDRGTVEDTDSDVNGKARLDDIIQKQLSELRELAGVSDAEEDDDSVLQDTLAEQSLPASQLILHDSQFTGDEDSMATHEGDSQPVVNEELVQSLVEASQRSSQYSQQAGGDDQDLAQLLADLTQEGGSPDDDSLLGSQSTQEEGRQRDDRDEMDDDVRESLEMSQVWPEDADEEEKAVDISHTTQEISGSEEDTLDSQATIPQVDGGADVKPAPIRKKSLGLKRPLPGCIPNPVEEKSKDSISLFPPEIKTYSNKKLSVKPTERPKERASLQTYRGVKKPSNRKTNGEALQWKAPGESAKPSGSSSLQKIHRDPKELTVQESSGPQRKRGDVSTGSVKRKDSLKGRAPTVAAHGRKDVGSLQLKGPSKGSFKKQRMALLSQEPSTSKSEIFLQRKTSGKRQPSDSKLSERSVQNSPRSCSPPPSSCIVPPPAHPSTPPLIKVPSTSDSVRLSRCPELRDFASLEDIKRNPSWNPCVMLIKCPISLDREVKDKILGSSQPGSRRRRKKNRADMKILSIRRSSFARKIVPPRKFMDEQFWTENCLRFSKKANETMISVDDISPPLPDGGSPRRKPGRPCKQKHESEIETVRKGSEISPVIDYEPPCLLSEGHLNSQSKQEDMPILEMISSPVDKAEQQAKKVVFTKTKALLQKKHHKSLLLSDKKLKPSRKSSFKKLPTETDIKRYKMLSRTFNKLSLSGQESSDRGTSSETTLVSSTSSSTIQTNLKFVSSISAGISSKRSSVQSEASTCQTHKAVTPDGRSSASPPSSQDSGSRVRRRSWGPRKRRGSDSSDDWAGSASPNPRRKSSVEGSREEFLFGKSYRFRKRERISYDDADFPDVGFDIMCWSDQEDSEDAGLGEGRKRRPVDWPKPDQGSVGSPKLSSPLSKERGGGGHELSPIRKRGRPPGSKNKPKLIASKLPFAKAAGSPSSRSKPHLSFTVDSMLRNGATPIPSGPCKPLSVITTGHSSCDAPSASSSTTTQAQIGQPVVSCSKLPASTSEWYRLPLWPAPATTPVNGHQSINPRESSEPGLYRDAMWNLGYFSPRSEEKEGSPPRCWSPSKDTESSEKERSQKVPDRKLTKDPRKHHKPSRHDDEAGDQSRLPETSPRQKKKKLESQTQASNGDGKSQNGNEWEGKAKQKLMPSFHSRIAKRVPQTKQMCNTDRFIKGGLSLSRSLKLSELHGSKSPSEKKSEGAGRDPKKEEASSPDERQSKPCLIKSVKPNAKAGPSPKSPKDKDPCRTEKGKRSSSAKSTSAEIRDSTSSLTLKSGIVPPRIPISEDGQDSGDGVTTSTKGPKPRKTPSSEEVPEPSKAKRNATQKDSTSEADSDRSETHSISDKSSDTSMPSLTTKGQPSGRRVMGVAPEGDNSEQDSSRNTGAFLTASPQSREEEDPSPGPLTPRCLSGPDSEEESTNRRQQSDPDSEAKSECSVKVRRDEKGTDRVASPMDLDASQGSSIDITPGQRRHQLTSDKETEDEEDLCSASQTSLSSLSLDVSLIISSVPSISPTKEVTIPEGSSSSQVQSQKSSQPSRRKSHKESNSPERLTPGPRYPEIIDLTMESPSCSQNGQDSTSMRGVASSLKSRASLGWTSTSETDWSMRSKATGSKWGGLGQRLEGAGAGSNSSHSASDSDTFFQLVCPETPSPRSQEATTSKTSNNAEPLTNTSKQKAEPLTKDLDSHSVNKTQTELVDGKTQTPPEMESKTQPSLESSTSPGSPAHLHQEDETGADKAVESPGNEITVEGDGSRDGPPRRETQSPLLSLKDSDESVRDKSLSQDGSLLPSEILTSPSPSSDEKRRDPHDLTTPPRSPTPSPRRETQTDEVTPGSMSAAPSVDDSGQISGKQEELMDALPHPGQDDDGSAEARSSSSPVGGAPLLSLRPRSPPISPDTPAPLTDTPVRLPVVSLRTPSPQATVWTPGLSPPSAEAVKESLQVLGLPGLHHQRAFCSNPEDVHKPSKPGVHEEGFLELQTPSHLLEAESRLSQTGLGQWQANLRVLKPHPLLSPSNVTPEPALKAALIGDSEAVITPASSPPCLAKVKAWLDKKAASSSKEDGKEEGNGPGDNDDAEKMDVDVDDKPTRPVSEDASEACNATPSLSQHKMVLKLKPEGQAPMTPSQSPSETSKGLQPPWKRNSMPTTQSPAPRNENGGQPSQSDTPRVNPLDRRDVGSLPQHSTPMGLSVDGGKACIPVTPISGWTRPKDPASCSRDRQSSSSSMRQTLLFTPAESSGNKKLKRDSSQIEGATPNNTCGFKMPQLNMQDAKVMNEVQHLTLMSLELHVKTRRDYCPDPDSDPIRAVFYSIQHDVPPQPDLGKAGRSHGDNETIHGVLIVEDGSHGNAGPSTSSSPPSLAHEGISNIDMTTVATETDLFEQLVTIIREHDPDILVGYEVQQHSWGYLLERAAFLDVDLCSKISRLPEFKKESSFSSERDAYGADHQSEINIAGRITLNLWRLMRNEVALTNYTFENVAFHVLHQRIPLFSYRKLTEWFDHRSPHLYRWRVIEHYSVRVRGSLNLLRQLDLIGRTSELARVFGIEFYSVLSRGSQYRVESMMLRTAKPKNYVAMSPSIQQRSRMNAPECIPLVMEPESRFYKDPVIVLDFQSLYPSMMIAYNYCYSTCLGRLERIANGGQYTLGCGSLSISASHLKKLLHSDSLHVSPNGIVFVKSNLRRGVLPTMLEQILKLRLIVKKAMKDFKDDKTLRRVLDSRQLALKLIANVTYGYTSANYSGRMPCIELGDSVVRKGRETLERAIHLVETTKEWGARVVYGDTDSMFVLVEGVSKERAFEVGREIRDAVTAANPKPVKLKLEKVYHPCILQSKKRYVGYSYESPDQAEPDFDAKGIETVRRDSCPAVGKILERSLKMLFTTRDVSQVKQYVQKQFQKILDGQASMQDLIFAKEYRGSHTYRPGACVPALEISRRLLAVDRRAEPRVGQRVPYVIVHGDPGLPLIQLVRTPNQVLQDPSLRLNTTYYLTRQLVPSLNRVFGLLGVDTMHWYQELPRWHRVTAHHQPGTPGKKGTISQYFASLNCVICEKITKESLCSDCKADRQATSTALCSRIQQWQLVHQDMTKICVSCCNFKDPDMNDCMSLDCPIMYKTNKLSRQLGQVPHYLQLLEGL